MKIRVCIVQMFYVVSFFFHAVRVYLPTLNRVRYKSSILFVHCLILIARLRCMYICVYICKVQTTCSVLAMVMIIIGWLLHRILSFSYFSRLLKVFKVSVACLVLTMLIVTGVSAHLGISI